MTERNDVPSPRTPEPVGAQTPGRWEPPPGTSGDITVVRTNLIAARADPRNCPTSTSAKARPLLRAEPEPPYGDSVYQTFAMGPLTTALDRIEHAGASSEAVLAELLDTAAVFGTRKPPAHPGLLSWTQEAIGRFLAAREADQQSAHVTGRARTQPVPHQWVAGYERDTPDARGATVYEQTAWGRRYASADGTVRELWLLSQGAAKASRPDAEVAAAAYVAAFGRPAAGGGRWPYRPLKSNRLKPSDTARVERVRVIEFGCGDGDTHTLADWDRDQCRERFTADAARALAGAVDGVGTVTGSSCVECKAISGCTAIKPAANMLEIDLPEGDRARISLSATDLRYYGDCPAKYHLVRVLKLKSPQPENPAIRLGRGIDAILNRRHGATSATPCPRRPQDNGPHTWTADEAEQIGEHAETAALMLGHHAEFCPLNDPAPPADIRVQQLLAVFDEEANIVFVATPDLLYARRAAQIWRETKTSSSDVFEGKPLLQNYPQLALAALMIDAGVIGGDQRSNLIELEVLTAGDVTRLEISPSHPRVLAEARDVLAGRVHALLTDRSFAAQPGSHCTGCEALAWCNTGRTHLNSLLEAGGEPR